MTADEFQVRRDEFRAEVLRAMHASMNAILWGGDERFMNPIAGARAPDLPEIFKLLDAQFEKNLAYVGVSVAEPDQ
jgi:hypothetical protein